MPARLLPVTVAHVKAGDVLRSTCGTVQGVVTGADALRINAALNGLPAEWYRPVMCGAFSTLPLPRNLRQRFGGRRIMLRLYRPIQPQERSAPCAADPTKKHATT